MTKLFLVVIAMVTAGTTAAAAQTQRLTVPAFFPVTLPGGSTNPDWTRIHNAGATVQIAVAGDSFKNLPEPGLGKAKTQFDLNHNACQPAPCQLVLGYVDTATGTRPITCPPGGPSPCGSIIDDVNLWHSNYGTYIDGIFFDQGPYFPDDPSQVPPGAPTTDSAFQSYYTQVKEQTLLAYPSAKIMLNASQYPYEWVMSVADYVVIWEPPAGLSRYVDTAPGHFAARSDQPYAPTNCTTPPCSIPPPDWWSSQTYAGRISHVIYSTNASDINQTITISRTRGSPSLYIYDGHIPDTTTHYSALPAFFEQEVAAVRPCNGPGSPSSDRYVDNVAGVDDSFHGNSRTCPNRTLTFALQNATGNVFLNGYQTFQAGVAGENPTNGWFAPANGVNMDCSGDTNRDPAREPAPMAIIAGNPTFTTNVVSMGPGTIRNCVIDALGVEQKGVFASGPGTYNILNSVSQNYTFNAVKGGVPRFPQFQPAINLSNNSFTCHPTLCNGNAQDVSLDVPAATPSSFMNNTFSPTATYQIFCSFANSNPTGSGNHLSTGGPVRCAGCAFCPF